MRKEMKKLLSYLLVAVLSVSTLVSSSITTEAVTLKNNREIVTVTTDAIEISQNEEGQTVYTLKDTVTNGLEIELSNGETVILDGMGNTILGKDAEGGNYTNADVALYVYGSGTLIIKDVTLIGGNSDEKGNGARGVSVRNDVSIICQGNVQISAGNVRSANTYEYPTSGMAGMSFYGKDFIVDQGSNVTISGSKGTDAISYNYSQPSRYPVANGGAGFIFSGNKLLVKGKLTLNGGSGGNADKTVYGYSNTYLKGGTGGSALQVEKGIVEVEQGAGDLTLNGGAAGLGRTEEYLGDAGANVEGCKITLQGENSSPRVYYIPKNTCVDAYKMLDSSEREGYALVGYVDEACSEIYDWNTPITEDKILYWNWKLEHRVAFDCAGGSDVESQSVIDDETVKKPVDPEREGYTFIGWYVDEACTEGYDFDTPVTGDKTIYANWKINEYTVSYNSVGGSEVEGQTVSYNSLAEKPADPEREGYTFTGWYVDEACTEEYDFSTPVTGDMTLYANWELNEYTVSYNSVGGSEVECQTVSHNGLAEKPADPEREGYTFAGWYVDEAYTTAYDFGTPVTSNFTIFAKWNKNSVVDDNQNDNSNENNNNNSNNNSNNGNNTGANKDEDKTVAKVYAVHFHVDGGTKVESQKVEDGKTVVEPATPTKANCGFGGWYTDKECQNVYDFTAKVNGDVELYAKWYTVKLNATSITLQKGKKTSAVNATVMKGDKVVSWKSSKKSIVTVNNKGKITGKKIGKATITVATQKGAKATFTVQVQKKKVTTKKITVTNVNKKTLKLKKGNNFTLKTEVTPITSQDKITYSSSNSRVVKVSSKGKIKAVKKGKATITVKSGSKKVKIKVNVTK